MKDTADYVAGFGIVVILALIIWVTILSEKEADRQCHEMINMAQTRSDSLVVYGMKPYTKYITCYDRLD